MSLANRYGGARLKEEQEKLRKTLAIRQAGNKINKKEAEKLKKQGISQKDIDAVRKESSVKLPAGMQVGTLSRGATKVYNPPAPKPSIGNITPEMRSVAASLGIKSIDSQNDLNQIFSRMGSGNSGNSSIGNITPEMRRVAESLGIQGIDSENDLRQIRAAMGSGNSSLGNITPEMRSVAASLGIQSIDSENDLRQIRDAMGSGNSSDGYNQDFQNMMIQFRDQATEREMAAEQRFEDMMIEQRRADARAAAEREATQRRAAVTQQTSIANQMRAASAQPQLKFGSANSTGTNMYGTSPFKRRMDLVPSIAQGITNRLGTNYGGINV